jgi:hypothetical protein
LEAAVQQQQQQQQQEKMKRNEDKIERNISALCCWSLPF